MVRESDYYYVYHDPDNYAQESFAWNIRRDHGFIPEEVREAELRQIEPDLSSDFRFAVRLKRHGYSVDPGRLVKELVQTFLENGGRLLRSRVAGIATVPGKGVALETAHGLVPFDKLVIAAGAWSQDLLTSLGIKVPMISERGYHLEFRDTGIRHNNPLMVSSGKYVATPMSGRLRLAGIVDFRAMSRPPQQRFWDSLARHARQLFPTANLAYIEQWMGHRPSLPDSLPVIGPVPEFPNIILAFGHQHIGLTAGPKTGRLVAQLTNDERPNEDLTGFSVIRFGR
ncbi:FAD-binding oxidoreductase [Ochrobactrum grignonense]|nr:FAD-binding oxidoreductase [Brucella grignonensis]